MSSIATITHLTVQVNKATILNDVSLKIPSGKIIGIVGGSGSGKTTLGLSLLNLLPKAMHITQGDVNVNGKNILSLSPTELRAIRGSKIGMIFQEPLSAFDPLFTIGAQLDETLAAHTQLHKAERHDKIMKVLERVEIDDTARIFKSYPHELSGGLRQRAMIAQAIIVEPQLVIADEPTSSLDVSIQAKIVALLKKLNKEQGMAIVFITHDLGLLQYLADDIAVMTQGKIVEYGEANKIMASPQHDYTKVLLKAY